MEHYEEINEDRIKIEDLTDLIIEKKESINKYRTESEQKSNERKRDCINIILKKYIDLINDDKSIKDIIVYMIIKNSNNYLLYIDDLLPRYDNYNDHSTFICRDEFIRKNIKELDVNKLFNLEEKYNNKSIYDILSNKLPKGYYLNCYYDNRRTRCYKIEICRFSYGNILSFISNFFYYFCSCGTCGICIELLIEKGDKDL